MIPGIFLLIIGLAIFIGAGIKLDDAPGVEKGTVAIMAIGVTCIVIGGIFLYSSAFNL